MTTLPQSTPMRLPRPGGQTALALPGAVGGPSASQGPAGGQMTLSDIWRVIRANLWLIILMVILGAGGGYGANYWLAKNHSKFTSTGYIQVQPTANFDPLKGPQLGMDMASLNIEQRTQASMLKTDRLLSDVVQTDSEIRDTAWFKAFPDATAAASNLRENLSVVPVIDTKLISISMTCPYQKDSRTIVYSVVSAFLRNQQELSRNKQQDRSQMLGQMRTKYRIRVQDLSDDVRQKASELSINGMGIAGRLSAKELELGDKVRAQMEIQSKAMAADSEYNNMVAALQRGETPGRIEEMANNDPIISTLKNNIDSLDVSIAEMTTKLGTSNPSVTALEKRRDIYTQKYAEARAEKIGNLQSSMLAELKGARESTKQSVEQINKYMADLKKEMGELSNKLAAYLTAQDELLATRELLKQVDRQLDDIAQVQQMQDLSSVAWNTEPTVPSSPSFPQLKVIMPMGIAIGLALSLGIAFLREVTDTTVRSPRDIQRVGQMSLLGMIPHESDDPQSAGARLPLVIFEAPHSIMAEQFRQVRTRLQHTASLDTTRSILVTSPSPGDGKTTIAINLAAGLALNGRRILLVDANFRRPEIHRVFGVGNEMGFSDVLSDINNFENAVRETPVPNLSVLVSGAKPANPTELLESQLLLDFIERALEEYDHVIFDSGPMLFVSDSVALAPRVDGVVTVVKARTNTRGVLQRMRDGLRQVKAEHLGVVLNAVRSQGGGYYGRNIKTYYEYQNAEG